jgi:hypothetical protein
MFLLKIFFVSCGEIMILTVACVLTSFIKQLLEAGEENHSGNIPLLFIEVLVTVPLPTTLKMV